MFAMTFAWGSLFCDCDAVVGVLRCFCLPWDFDFASEPTCLVVWLIECCCLGFTFGYE